MAEKNKEVLNEKEVWDTINFAKNLVNSYNTYYTPTLMNSRMKDINMNPQVATAEKIENALQNPKESEDALVGFSQFFEYTNMLYKRTIKYMAQVPSFDFTYECINCDDYSMKSYRKDEKVLEEFFDRLNHRAEFRRIVEAILRQETYYTVLRDDGDKYTLQELPFDYCKITGRSEYGLLFDFDMQWFLNPSVPIDMYPDVFKKYYKKTFIKPVGETYNPSAKINSRTGKYIYYVQTSPEDGFWAFKFNDNQAGNVPFLSPMFSDLVLTPIIRNLQTNSFMIEANKLIIGNIPLMKDNKTGNVKDMLAISPETAGKFMGLLRQAIDTSIGVGTSPMDGWETIDFKANNTMMIDFNRNTMATSGISNRLIYSYDKMNAIETIASLDVDKFLSTQIYPQLQNFLEFNINQRTSKFKFKITLEGSNLSYDREKRLESAMSMATSLGAFDYQSFASALGQNPHTFVRRLEMSKAKGVRDLLEPITTAFQQSGKSEAGREKKNTSDLTDSGQQSRESGSNIEKGGDI